MKSPVPDTVKEQLTIYRMKQQIDPAREAARAKRAAEEAAASAGTIQD